MTKRVPIFEHETCGRCGGGGHYSYNQINGTTCFGCGGSGLRLTKRGQAAQKFYRAKVAKLVRDLVAGVDRVRMTGVAGLIPSVGPSVIRSIERDEANSRHAGCDYFVIRCDGFSLGVEADRACDEYVPTAEERKAAIEAALAYQATLTKTGKPKKTRE